MSVARHLIDCFWTLQRSAATAVLAPSDLVLQMLLFTLQLTEGSGSILVVAVGVNSEYGKTMSLVMTESASTPLQEHLEVLATSIGKVGLAVAIVCFSVLLIRLVLAGNVP